MYFIYKCILEASYIGNWY